MDLLGFGSLIESIEREENRHLIDTYQAVGMAFGGDQKTVKEWMADRQTAGSLLNEGQDDGDALMRDLGGSRI